ncbi:Mut7-C RNAse domain-containing protein [Candidatus Bathyarchaeota archaeon]|nr:Mut7-C RNAse domain-containing protein [Candidatus Bathyarchaeota archaeon]
MRFLADGMLGNITRWLRLLGHDVEYEPAKDDRTLLNRSRIEGRVLITADMELFRLAKRRGVDAVLVKETSTAQTLSRLSKKLKLRIDFDELESRCPTCGSTIVRVAKPSVRERVPEGTYRRYMRFWACTNPACSKIYWRGSHWKRIRKTIAEAKQGGV